MADPKAKRRAPTEVLERLAEAADRYVGFHNRRMLSNDGEALAKACDDYRAAVAPLRTRAEVDAEIVATVRARDGWHNSARLCELISEPTQDSGPSSADTEEVPPPRPPVSPAGAAISRCPCCHTPGGRHDPWCQYPRDYGPAGVAAAKESKDNAAAPEGAANEEVEACGCEHTEALLTRLRRIHRICDCYASIDGDRQLEIWTLSDA